MSSSIGGDVPFFECFNWLLIFRGPFSLSAAIRLTLLSLLARIDQCLSGRAISVIESAQKKLVEKGLERNGGLHICSEMADIVHENTDIMSGEGNIIEEDFSKRRGRC